MTSINKSTDKHSKVANITVKLDTEKACQSNTATEKTNVKGGKSEIRGAVDPKYKARFDAFKGGETMSEKLEMLIDAYETKQSLNVDQKRLSQAAEKMQTTSEIIMEIAIDSYLTKILEGESVEADIRARDLLFQMIRENDAANIKYYINTYTFKEFVRKQTGKFSISRNVMLRCLQAYKPNIVAHHKLHNISENHNREKTRTANTKSAPL